MSAHSRKGFCVDRRVGPGAEGWAPSVRASGGADVGLDGLEDKVFDAVLFDMDGTLVDSTAAVYRAWAAGRSSTVCPRTQMRGHDGIPAASIVAKFLPEERARRPGSCASTSSSCPTPSGLIVLPGAAEALAALVDAPNAIATSCTMPLARARIASSGLARTVGARDRRPGRARQAGARPLPARGGAARASTRALPGRRGRAARAAGGPGRRLRDARRRHHDGRGTSWRPTRS